MTPSEAVDEMMGVFYAVWSATGYQSRFEDAPPPQGEPQIPTGNQPWARVTLRHVDGAFISLPNAFSGTRKHQAVGFIRISVFSPQGKGHRVGYDLANKLMNAFSKLRPNSCVAYSNHKIKEIASITAMSQVDFMVDFSYESVR